MRFFARLSRWVRTVKMVRASYRAAHGRAPRLLAPRRFTEKMQWRKLFDFDPLFAVLCDKFAVRAYISARIGEEFQVPLLWHGGIAQIPFATLTPPYVLKSTHASGHVAMIPAHPVDEDALRTLAGAWLGQDYARSNGELGYAFVPKTLIAERMIFSPDGSPPQERRVFVFAGKAAMVNTVFTEEGRIRNGAFHTPDWRRLDWRFSRWIERDFSPPARLADMLRLAEILGAGLDHVRVDFYDCGPRIYVGELTLYSWSGYSAFAPDEADFALGAFWHLRHPGRRALHAVLTRARPDGAGPD